MERAQVQLWDTAFMPGFSCVYIDRLPNESPERSLLGELCLLQA